MDSLTLLGIVIGYLGGFGGRTHKKDAELLLKKVRKKDQVDRYFGLCKEKPREIMEKIKNWVRGS